MSNPWFQFFHSDWISGTRRLSPTARAIYIDVLCMIYSAGGPIERDDVSMARECAVTLGTFKKAIAELIRQRKFEEVDGKIFNEKAAKSIEKADKKSESSSRAADKRWNEFRQGKQQSKNADALPTHEERICESDASTTTTTTRIEDGIRRAGEESQILEWKLRDAAGWQNQPAPNLFVTGQIQALIDNGAILEIDVLSTVRALAPKVRSPTSWNYFISPIAQARDDRLAAGKLKFEGKPNGTKPKKQHPIDIAADKFMAELGLEPTEFNS